MKVATSLSCRQNIHNSVNAASVLPHKCGICIAAKRYMKNLVKDRVTLSKFGSYGRPIGPHRKTRKFVEDKHFDPNGPFFKILDKRGREPEIERQDLEQQYYLLSTKFLFDNDFQQPANCDGTDPHPSVCHEDITLDIGDNTAQQNSEETVTLEADDEILEVVIADDIDNGMYGILGVYCNRI